MAATPTTPFPRLLAPAPPHLAARPSFSSTLRTPSISLSYSVPVRRHRHRLAAASRDTASNKGQEQEQEPAPSTAADGGAEKSAEAEGASAGEKSPEAVAAELKEVLRARKAAEAADGGGGGWWAGVVQEMSEIEWPAPGKVLGTTGVVLGVIAGSTVALLSVNALLAELSDRVFAGRGLQDFFSG
ncbi:unnamed protein product [Urochloa decumbens]|uniref:Uncharacterized protein n=1 Tax=Urochloa decumbens TaxID=240449 RepID=A0ABC9DBG6_9POAL